MSTPGAFGRRGNPAPTLPRGEVLGTYETYLEAAHVVDRLAKSDFPVDKVSIVGNDLKTVERVTGRMSWGRAALGGALSGLWFGLLVGLLFTFFGSPSLTPLFAAILIGAAGGMFFGLATYAISRRRKDFTSMTNVLASNYQVIVDPELINRARNDLGAEAPVGVTTWTPQPATPPVAPPSDAPGAGEPPVEPAPPADPVPPRA
ncbi:hypothetical protein FJ656_14920 [Schumannella luteola]|uniref:General stress protein 17M-like domain-containing protein n=1 Tax=Schumannella luteola TaxID=472059 RepID=A0A852YAI3_9MICO|nr:general stress protein [Schumannella luteola]NYG99503.1 hypothetical protein [Schumannella luteola]TPX03827.1 hypothetical protein FJ656_14920 [Schumannella luteola]